MNNQFVVYAGRFNHWFLKSHHATELEALQALKKTIDIQSLHVAPATVIFADNGNVRRWDFKI